jgi:curli production assembly/transport component CsgG
VGYDTNTVTGGIGAAMLGIGGDAKYQQDTVTVYLRAVSVKTGEVLTSVTTSKTITSYAVDVNVYRYISASSILETENGFTTNEPAMLALQQAIDKAVYGLVMEGVGLHLWNFADPQAAWPSVWRYQQERDGHLSAAQVAAAESRAHRPAKTLPVQAEDPPPPPPPPPSPVAMASPAVRLGASAAGVPVDFALSQPSAQPPPSAAQMRPQAPALQPLPAPATAQAFPAPQSSTPNQRASAPS